MAVRVEPAARCFGKFPRRKLDPGATARSFRCASLGFERSSRSCPWATDELDVTVSLACEDTTTVGPVKEEIRSSRTLDIAEDGAYEITVSSTSDGTSGVRLTHCGDCREAVDVIVLAGTSRTVDLLAGRYHAAFVTDVGQPGDVTLNLSKAPVVP